MKTNDRIKLVLGAMLIMSLVAIASTNIPAVRAAVNWSLSRTGSTLSIDSAGQVRVEGGWLDPAVVRQAVDHLSEVLGHRPSFCGQYDPT